MSCSLVCIWPLHWRALKWMHVDTAVGTGYVQEEDLIVLERPAGDGEEAGPRCGGTPSCCRPACPRNPTGSRLQPWSGVRPSAAALASTHCPYTVCLSISSPNPTVLLSLVCGEEERPLTLRGSVRTSQVLSPPGASAPTERNCWLRRRLLCSRFKVLFVFVVACLKSFKKIVLRPIQSGFIFSPNISSWEFTVFLNASSSSGTPGSR